MNVAAKFPDIKFEHATGYKPPRTSRPMTRASTRVGGHRHHRGPHDGIEQDRLYRVLPDPRGDPGHQLSFIHARKVNPDVEMRVVWAYSWFDPAKEAEAASALLAEGVDVILQHTDSTAPLAQAQQAGAIGFGQASDMAAFKPSPRVASIIDEWSPYYIKRVGAVLDGTWKAGPAGRASVTERS